MAKLGTSSNNLFRDASHMPVPVGGSFQTADSTASPNVSPLTVSTAIIDLSVPANAIKLVITSTSNALRVSDISAATTYFVVPQNGNVAIDCSRMNDIYVLRDGNADAVVQFYFSLV